MKIRLTLFGIVSSLITDGQTQRRGKSNRSISAVLTQTSQEHYQPDDVLALPEAFRQEK
jgi:hypothetical protein